MTTYTLETILRYAYFNGYNCIQWADPVRQCLLQSEQDLQRDLCDLLLKHMFSTARVHNIFLESYLTYALTGDPQAKQGMNIDDTKTLIKGKFFLSQLVAREERFATSREYGHQWSCILRILPSLLLEVDGDRKENLTWAPILTQLLIILSHIVAGGLYPQRKSDRHSSNNGESGDNSDNDDDMTKFNQTEDLSSSQQPNFSLTNNTTQMAMDSQLSFDPDATWDMDGTNDATQPDPFVGQDEQKFNISNSPPMTAMATTTTTAAAEATTTTAMKVDVDSISRMDTMPTTNIHDVSSVPSTGAQQQQQQQQQQYTSQSSSLYPSTMDESISSSSLQRNRTEWDNAIAAANIMIDLIEKKGVKRIIEKYEQGQKEISTDDNKKLDSNEPWVTCHEILVPGNQKATSSTATVSSTSGTHNVYIQKLLLLIERLTDRDLERRLAVHMKYHELEDEGTARAMPSAGLMGLIYHMVQIRPALNDDELVNRLVKLQAIKGSFDESFYLELWFAALTGLREASLSTSCQNMVSKHSSDNQQTNINNNSNSCNTTVATNRLLWKNLVLVKLPHLINKVQERKQKEELANYSLKRDPHRKSMEKDEENPIESSLLELKTFTGLLNACSPPACCSEFYVPSSKSSKYVDRFAFGGDNNSNNDDNGKHTSTMDDDDMMMMINDNSYATTADYDTPEFIKTIRSISADDIFTSIVRSCQPYHFLRDNKVDVLLNTNNNKNNTKKDNSRINKIKDEEENNKDGDGDDDLFNEEPKLEEQYSSMLDDDMMNGDELDRKSDNSDKSDVLAQVDQNIDQRMKAIQSNVTKASVSELIHIGFVSLIHWRKIVDFLLNLLQTKAETGDIRALSRLCDALDECPSAIDLILQLYPPNVLLGPLETICNEWNPSEDYIMDVDDGASGNNDDDGDDDTDGIQNWYCKFGKIWTLVLVVASKFDITRVINTIFKNRNGLCYQFFVTGPIIYGVHDHDQDVEELVDKWLSAMGGDGISDDLLRTTKLQMLLRATPTLIDRLLFIYQAGHVELDTFTGVLSYFQKRFLRFVLVPGVTRTLCDELLNRNATTSIICLDHLFVKHGLPDTLVGLCGNAALGSLRAWKERQRQYNILCAKDKNIRNNNIQSDTQQQQNNMQQRDDEDRVKILEQFFITKLDLDDEQHLSFPETISSGVTRRTLFDKTREMFKYIVKSGRSMYMNDVDGDAKTLWEPVKCELPKQVVSHYLDLVMFQAALKMGGTHWFIGMIVDEVLEAGKSGGAVRAAELGSCLVTTPLMYNSHGGNACLSMLRCLLQDVIPSSIKHYAMQNTSFFQGQTLGVFVSDCLVLMYQQENDMVDELGCKFFEALVIDRVRGGEISSLQLVPQSNEDGSLFSSWDDDVVSSPVWRGFVKGLMSNPFIKEMWPNAYAS
ncbi:mediator complex subunit Med5-domain-containing protein [Halteromyces radiatus]|uniref:mediator complex subunit Med5-domain-containing protein n=1 Tax=Halteromyces radiatus TaxID=101107 RepID=UPI00221FADF3|nr:mediator complex subunit Med5-domain-containing protein [Halteromyces radiatus]KAI8089632.1 mediator complex subunit Med5-domain-containing protein [Halteromyces radiatus]